MKLLPLLLAGLPLVTAALGPKKSPRQLRENVSPDHQQHLVPGELLKLCLLAAGLTGL